MCLILYLIYENYNDIYKLIYYSYYAFYLSICFNLLNLQDSGKYSNFEAKIFPIKNWIIFVNLANPQDEAAQKNFTTYLSFILR